MATWVAIAKRAALGVTFAGVAFTGVMGFAHTKPGRPLLAWMGVHGAKKVASCPLGFDVAQTPEQKEGARRSFASTHHGAERASERPALGFLLDKTTKGDVSAWAIANGVRCVRPKSGPDLDCADVPSAVLPEAFRGAEVRSVWLNFGAEDRLISIIAVRRTREAGVLSATFSTVTAEIAREAGPASSTQGDASAEVLASGALRQASAEYRFRNYYALARATNMGDGFVLTEEYRSLPDS